MNLPPLGLPLPAAGAVQAPGSAHAEPVMHRWMLQLQRAGAMQPPSAEDAAKDESCGLPFAPADPQPPRAVPKPAPAAVSDEPVSTHQISEPGTERTPLRVHVQHQPGVGLKVWLGIDGHAAVVTQRATAAVADLRRSFGGERIAAVVCNGVPVYTRTDISIQPTFPEDTACRSDR